MPRPAPAPAGDEVVPPRTPSPPVVPVSSSSGVLRPLVTRFKPSPPGISGRSAGPPPHSVVPEMFNESDDRRSGLKWVDQSCSAGSVRIFMPHLPHGNKGNSGEERIAVPIYHTAVSKDGINLKIAECGTKDDSKYQPRCEIYGLQMQPLYNITLEIAAIITTRVIEDRFKLTKVDLKEN